MPATTTAIPAPAKTKARHGAAARNGRVRPGSSTNTLLAHARRIVATAMRALSTVRRLVSVTNGQTTMSGQCHR